MLGGEGGSCRRGRSCGPSARSDGEAKAVISRKTSEASWCGSPRGAPEERSKHGKVSLARRATAALPACSCGQHLDSGRSESPRPPGGLSAVLALLNAQIR